MTANHARALRRLARADDDGRIRMYRSFDPQAPVVGPGESEQMLDVDDPWYGDIEDFEHCLTEIEAAADGVVELVRSQLAARERS